VVGGVVVGGVVSGGVVSGGVARSFAAIVDGSVVTVLGVGGLVVVVLGAVVVVGQGAIPGTVIGDEDPHVGLGTVAWLAAEANAIQHSAAPNPMRKMATLTGLGRAFMFPVQLGVAPPLP